MSHLRYLWYLLRHKWFVLKAGMVTLVPLSALIIHDWSKFLPCEWFPYVRNFYGDKDHYQWVDEKGKYVLPGYCGRGLMQVEAEFDRAWLHHQHFNPHHWQHWILRNDDGSLKCLPMPERYWREMVADWMGAGRTINGRWEADNWYIQNAKNIFLHEETRELVKTLLAAACRTMRGEV